MTYRITKDFLLEKIQQRSSRKQIASEVGCSESVISSRLKRHGLRLGRGPTIQVGTQFELLTVIGEGITGRKGLRIPCKCRCGNHSDPLRHDLLAGRAVSCGCKRHLRGHQSRVFRGYGELGRKHWSRILASAKSRKIEVSLTIEEAWNLFESQNRQCALTGHRIGFDYKWQTTASLDRIDSSQGYHLSNVQWVHKPINSMKQGLSQERFLELCRKISNHCRVPVLPEVQ